MNWQEMMDAARAENAHGIQMRGSKRYTTAAVRVELMRRYAGALGVSTEIIQWAAENGQPIVVKATIADETGRVLATGHAEEIRGKGQVNATSALENAETSAIGRALAALGLSGGEFASANEMEGVDRKAEATKVVPRQQETQQPEPPKDASFDARAAADRIIKTLRQQGTVDALKAAWAEQGEARKAVYVADLAMHEEIKAVLMERKAELEEIPF